MINFVTSNIIKFYSKLSTSYENFFLKSNQHYKNDLTVKGYYYDKIENGTTNNINLDLKKITINKYINKYILEKTQIVDLLNHIFVKNRISNKITSLTGFKYSIDYFIFYETFHIKSSDQDKGWYANHWHFDKPYSENTLKLIMPMDIIDDYHGPIEIINISNSKNFFFNRLADFKLTGSCNEYLLFMSNQCLHRAGNPNPGLVRKQIMFQLNPAREWSVSNKIDILQKFREPKFPLFYNRKKIKINKFISGY